MIQSIASWKIILRPLKKKSTNRAKNSLGQFRANITAIMMLEFRILLTVIIVFFRFLFVLVHLPISFHECVLNVTFLVG